MRPWDCGCVACYARTPAGEAVPKAHRARAIEECVAGVVQIPRGTWNGYRSEMPGGVGLLVLNGLLIRQVGIGLGYGAECLARGIFYARGRSKGAQATLPQTTGWRGVLQPTRLAVLDRPAGQRFAHTRSSQGSLWGARSNVRATWR